MAAMGHRRLSIIDLAGGSQPMASHDGRFTVVFNGEIYNYIEIRNELLARGARFTTCSDTEVILEAWRTWGAECLPRFRGMFAFALHDDVTRTVVLARDQFGKKPLFLAERQTVSGPVLVFGSEIAALLAHPEVRCRTRHRHALPIPLLALRPRPLHFFSQYPQAATGKLSDLAATER